MVDFCDKGKHLSPLIVFVTKGEAPKKCFRRGSYILCRYDLENNI